MIQEILKEFDDQSKSCKATISVNGESCSVCGFHPDQMRALSAPGARKLRRIKDQAMKMYLDETAKDQPTTLKNDF